MWRRDAVHAGRKNTPDSLTQRKGTDGWHVSHWANSLLYTQSLEVSNTPLYDHVPLSCPVILFSGSPKSRPLFYCDMPVWRHFVKLSSEISIIVAHIYRVTKVNTTVSFLLNVRKWWSTHRTGCSLQTVPKEQASAHYRNLALSRLHLCYASHSRRPIFCILFQILHSLSSLLIFFLSFFNLSIFSR